MASYTSRYIFPLSFFSLLLSFVFLALLLPLPATAYISRHTTVCANATDSSQCWRDFWSQPELANRSETIDWGFFNYSSYEGFTRRSVVRCNGKVYDPMSFKGQANDSYAFAFQLSTEVAVAAAQNRSGHLFDVAVVEGDEDYKRLMSQIQLDLKGDRSAYYAEYAYPRGRTYRTGPLLPAYRAYLARMYRYIRNESTPTVNITNAEPIFQTMLQQLKLATEEKLGEKMNVSNMAWGRGQIHTRVSSPFALNSTYQTQMYNALTSLNMIQVSDVSAQHPYLEWYDHSNDVISYSGPNGTQLAFENARAVVEMNEYEDGYRYGDFVCGTSMLEDLMQEEAEMKKNGTWVEPPRRQLLDWDCNTWAECWRAYPSWD